MFNKKNAINQNGNGVRSPDVIPQVIKTAI